MTRSHPLVRPILLACVVLAACSVDPATGPLASTAPRRDAAASPAAKPMPTGITIALVVEPQSATDVAFTTAGKKLRDFSLDDDADPALPNGITFDKLKASTYTVQAQPASGLTLAKIACTTSGGTSAPTTDLASGAAMIPLDVGESVTCTFTEVNTWQTGDVTTYTQQAWSDDPTAVATLAQHYGAVYASTFGALEVGLPGAAGYSATFSDAGFVEAVLPATGTPAALGADLLNPTSTSAGALLGEVVALKLNVDFADAGDLPAASGFRVGDLSLCGPGLPAAVKGATLRQALQFANTVLGGGTTNVSVDDITLVAAESNAGFGGGTPSAWAQAHLVAGPCP